MKEIGNFLCFFALSRASSKKSSALLTAATWQLALSFVDISAYRNVRVSVPSSQDTLLSSMPVWSLRQLKVNLATGACLPQVRPCCVHFESTSCHAISL